MLRGAVARKVHPGDIATDSVVDDLSDNEDLMAKYEELASELIDVGKVEYKRSGSDLRPPSVDQLNGVLVFVTRQQSLRHYCEVHCPLRRKWKCVFGNCGTVFDIPVDL